jgi:hypothetical protein
MSTEKVIEHLEALLFVPESFGLPPISEWQQGHFIEDDYNKHYSDAAKARENEQMKDRIVTADSQVPLFIVEGRRGSAKNITEYLEHVGSGLSLLIQILKEGSDGRNASEKPAKKDSPK